MMDDATVEKLLALNRAFYTSFARSFAASRAVRDPALMAILPYIPLRARVLDVGCGNGRLAVLLDRERPGAIYVGLDVAEELIEAARAQAQHLAGVSPRFYVADVARQGWSELLMGASFDRVTALAVLHHIPSFERRVQVLREAAGLLAPDGRLILSTWQFLSSERMQRKLVAWAEVGIAKESLEAGDYLLDWRRGGHGFRYCHLIDEVELERLAMASALCVEEMFRAGGREGNLSLFGILRPVG